MLDRLTSLFSTWTSRANDAGNPARRVVLSAAVLMVETAVMDGTLQDEEREKILALLTSRFALAAEAAEILLSEAEQANADATQLLPFTRSLTDALDAERRIEIVEMLWEVVYADGHLHDYEANLVRRISGLLYVADQDSGAARKRAMARLGLSD